MSYILINAVAGFLIGWALGSAGLPDALFGFAGLFILLLNQAPRFE